MTMVKTQLSSTLKTRLDEVYPDIFNTWYTADYAKLPDTVASAKRSFIKLKIIKTFNRSHMADSRLFWLAMLSIEASCVCSLDLDDVIKAFACQKTRSKPFWYLYNVTLFMIFSSWLLCNIFHVCYCATTQWFLLFCCMTGVVKHFLRRATLKILLLPRAACSYYIYYIYNRIETLKKFYMSYHKMKVTIVTSGWVKMRFRMKRVKKKLDNSNLIDKITLT